MKHSHTLLFNFTLHFCSFGDFLEKDVEVEFFMQSNF